MTHNTKLKITMSIIGTALIFGAAACTKKTEDAATKPADQQTTTGATSNMAATNAAASPAASGLKIEDLKVGTGAEAVAGKKVKVHYTGTLTDGKKFDSSLDRGTPFDFNLGAGQVIKGWDQGVAGMKIGGKRKLTIPADLGYGAAGAGGVIPPGATLIFEVELLGVE